MTFQAIAEHNFPSVLEIYQEGINTGMATFETSLPSWTSWDEAHLNYGKIVAVEGKEVLGWAALSGVSNRCVYGGVAEVSVYVASKHQGKGVGKSLLKELISISEKNDIWTLQSGIFPENKGSIILHEKCGFRTIGFREKIGKLKGKWKDNVLMERRSRVVGL